MTTCGPSRRRRGAGRGPEIAAADAADLIVLAHGVGPDPLSRAFADLTRLAARATKPLLLVGVSADTPLGAGLAGLVKTAALEWAAAWKCVVLEEGVPLPAVADELTRGGVEREARLGPQGRAVRIRIAGAPAAPPRAVTPGPWIVSGGARGVTAACALELARAGARRIVLRAIGTVDEPVARAS